MEELKTHDLYHLLEQHQEPVLITQKHRFFVRPAYYEFGFEGTSKEMHLRKGAYLRLLTALQWIPEQYGLLLLDGYRTLLTQQQLWAYFEAIVQTESSLEPLTSEEIYNKTKMFVADPKGTGTHVPNHATGGAIDLTLCDSTTGEAIDMGSTFDEFTERSATNYYADKRHFLGFHQKRMILKTAMEKAGFVNYSKEWWHFDIGNRTWFEAKGLRSDVLYLFMKLN